MASDLRQSIFRQLRAASRGALPIAMLLIVSACSSGKSDPPAPPTNTNRAPTAIAGADFTATEQSTAQLNGGGSDPDAGDTLSFAWAQTGGQTVSITNADVAQASFMAPDVAVGAPESLTFRLTVTDAAGLSANDDIVVMVEEPPVIVNRPPVANAGSDSTVLEQTTVTLSGSGTDPDVGDTLSYSWTQTGGQSVAITGGSMAQASFVSPDVVAGVPEDLTFRLTVMDAAGLNATDDVTITVQEAVPDVTISGTVSFEFVPPATTPFMCAGLDFAGTQTRPIRRATVQLIDSLSGTVLASMPSSDAGDYAFTVAANTDVNLRVRAELKQTAPQPWDVEVRDNVVPGYDPEDPGAPPESSLTPLAQRPLYVLDGNLFNSGSTNSTRNLTANTGWGGSSYTGVRAAAPFAVLDTLLSAMLVIVAEDASVIFPPLDAFWSSGNRSTTGTSTRLEAIASGQLGSSFYLRSPPLVGASLFLLGMDGDDTEEFDDHVIAHEWGHYFEDMFSRSDSIGGPHGPDDRLDMRVAFGEGFATALAGIVLNNPDYCDTLWSGNTLTGFRISAESHITSGSWYDELALMKIVYDLWDTVDDGLDDSSIGFGPIYDVMVGPQASNPAFTSIFTFAEALKQMGTGQNAFIDAQLAREGIVATGIEKYASTETDDLGGAEDVLPVYTPIVPDGSVTNICSNRQYDSNVSTPQANANKLSEHRFLRVTITEQRPYTFSVITTTVTPYANDPTSMQDQSDPDLYYYLNGQIQNLIVGGLGQGTSGDENQEVFTTPISLAPGDYVIDLLEWRYEDPDTPTGPLPDDQYPARTCFDFSITPS